MGDVMGFYRFLTIPMLELACALMTSRKSCKDSLALFVDVLAGAAVILGMFFLLLRDLQSPTARKPLLRLHATPDKP